jgi:hypothetical protein
MLVTSEYAIGSSAGDRKGSNARAEREMVLSMHDAEAERRRGLRVRQSRPIKIYEPTTSRYFGGQTLDVSATGMRVELPVSTPVRPGYMVNIHVGLNEMGESLANRRQMMQAKVVWVERALDLTRSRLTAGIELTPNIAAHLDAA